MYEQLSGSCTVKIAAINLLPRLRNQDETEVVIVVLPESTPVYGEQQ
ncbi:hypothetical protein [Acetobacterium bakii]|nr:hypothetical protein [Acetobacterium bakii]